ncbi:hypothetical protein CAPTEDRAFT_109619 [Capitella teleta]|uniref:3-beta hydroxysteroid dehydrogenase/isomerase domain-containing protein n=1 Tax=Capitella teleta TaxID=283909 RepID=R7UUH2_CAPTE|nr:hypothetical protein CAPTEDRAFT_109619 [Capitella teleta]|eukprot:ELU09823.1 hypothetical protein CAPTEDRAFT_109619 [Capitella teleta]
MVTGSSGFLGQHVIRVLQEKTHGLKEIRAFDLKAYENNLGKAAQIICHTEYIPVKSCTGDIRNQDDVKRALRGVDAVVHSAGVISFGTFPDIDTMADVNINGTHNLIDCCVEQGVTRLVHTSTVDVVIGYEPITDGDESLQVPPKFLFTGYPISKYHSEKLVLGANGKLLENRGNFKQLSTVALRPNVMYGELDPYYVTNGLKSASNQGGTLPRVGNGRALFQQAYAGNVAWAHVLALHQLGQPGGELASGHAFFIPDDTPLMNSFAFMEPFLKARGFSLSTVSIPYPLMYAVFYVTELFLKIVKPIHKISLDANLASLIYINMDVYFKRSKAEQLLGYKPIYSYDESLKKSMEYYKTVEL